MACLKKLILGAMFKESEEMLSLPFKKHLKPEKKQLLTKATMSMKTQKLLSVKRSTSWPDDCPHHTTPLRLAEKSFRRTPVHR